MSIFKYFLIFLLFTCFSFKSFGQFPPPIIPPASPPGHQEVPSQVNNRLQPAFSPDSILKEYGDSARRKMEAGDYEGAFKYCDLRIKKTPFRMQYMYADRAQAETYLFKYKDAIRDYDTVIGLDSSAAAAYMNQAYLYMQVHEVDKAFKDYARGLKADKDSSLQSAIYLSRGNAYLSIKKTKDAESDFTKALEYNPKSWQAFLQRGSIRRFAKDTKNALSDLNIAYKLKPNDPDVLLLRGMILYESNLFRESAEDLKEAVKVKKTADTWFYLGMAEMNIGEDSLARENFTKIIQNDPKNVLALNTRGKVNFEMKHPDLAIKDYTRVIQLKPKSGEGYANRAYVYAQIGEHDKACADLHKAASLGIKKAQDVLKKYCGN